MSLSENQIRIISIIATILSVAMYFAYIPQIQMNLTGHKGSPWQPLIAAFNCTLWVVYSLGKKNRDIPIALANAPGIIFGLAAFFTAL